MAKAISGTEYSLGDVFSSKFEFHIPLYQRPYSWGIEQAGELFLDLFEAWSESPDDAYFLGSIVLIIFWEVLSSLRKRILLYQRS